MENKLTGLEGHAGYAAPRYSRGLRTTLLLLEAGRRLLRERTLEQVSIQEICAHAGVTTGAFYSRFEGKESYFKALQALVLATLRKGMAERLAQLDTCPPTLEDAVRTLARDSRIWAYRNAGVLRASLVARVTIGEDPIRQLNRQYMADLASRLARLHPAGASPELELRIRFAHQALAGTLLYALINRDSTFALSDRRLDMEMARAFLLYVA
ncbi:TetR/AcrR family transcriptional regulator [Cupriavidus sp. UYPR2.512]|uniref:TetR/AcrR family transcriptional regulator n=1 Tax=Cupriavidus sp. UYPR2.512 TaxID=1080187 RepID=UPI000378284E|nr:TetR/AcrR family transcriptional regulator [Cupriavidus sp. UYPR2.512]UIF86502.1 helix-turn-helix transcriptional regulator [Cupriavidus necator]